MGVAFHTYPVRGESNFQCNANQEMKTLSDSINKTSEVVPDPECRSRLRL